MLTADDAKQLYNPQLTIVNQFLTDYIEPAIKAAAPTKRAISWPGIDYYYVGHAYELPKELLDKIKENHPFDYHYKDVDVSKDITEKLNNLGYKVTHNISLGTDRELGRGLYTISWS